MHMSQQREPLACIVATRAYAWALGALSSLKWGPSWWSEHWCSQLSVLPGASQFPPPLVLLRFSSTNGQFVQLTGKFFVALRRTDIPHLQYSAVRVALLPGEVFFLRVATRLLERAASVYFFRLGVGWLCVACSGPLYSKRRS
jgi:hypothetical protein